MRLRLFLICPVVILVIVFALSNRVAVPIGLWPMGWLVQTPLSAAMLTSMALGFVAGLVMAGLSSLASRRRARRAEMEVAALKAELITLRTPVRSTVRV